MDYDLNSDFVIYLFPKYEDVVIKNFNIIVECEEDGRNFIFEVTSRDSFYKIKELLEAKGIKEKAQGFKYNGTVVYIGLDKTFGL
jgi:hypothetical protein